MVADSGAHGGGDGMVPVLIAGGGPVGLALAVELGTRGVRCLLIEKGDGTVEVPKMSQLTARTMEFCRRWGIAQQAKQAGWPEDLPCDFVYFTSLSGYELFRQVMPPYREQQARLTNSPEGPRHCPQIFFDPILLRRARSLPSVTLRHLTRLDSFVEGPECLEATLVDAETGREERMRTSYLVGCDGFDGAVRRGLGVGYGGSGILSSSVSIFFRSAELTRLHGKGWARFYRFVDGGGHWSDLIAIDGRELWRLTLLDCEAPPDISDFDAEGALLRAAGFDFPHEILSVLPWRRRELVANTYGRGRVFIAGDAAHQMSPTGGLGMNTGVGDAVDLGWKLAAVLAGWGGSDLLTFYETERRPVAVSSVMASSRVYEETMALPSGPALVEDSPEGDQLRQRFKDAFGGLRPVTEPIAESIKLGYCYDPSPIIVSEGAQADGDDLGPFSQSARPGVRAPHAWIEPGKSTLDLFGVGFVLLRFVEAPADGLVRAADQRGVPFEIVDLRDQQIAQLHGRKLVLVRPDGHVVWRGDSCPEDPGRLIDQVRGAPVGVRVSSN